VKLLVSICFILFLQIEIIAQKHTIIGVVLEASTKQPVVGATVFINNTSKYSVTDSEGKYSIAEIEDEYFVIICSKKGYETLEYTFTAKANKSSIRFEMTAAELEKPLPESELKKQQDRWGTTFTSMFLGESPHAGGCEIANPEVIRFIYSDSSKTLEIYTVEPLIIFNEALGYMITCIIDDYFVTAKGDMMYKVFKWYKPLTTKKTEIAESWVNERKLVYSNSILHFMRALYADSLKQQGFEVKLITRVYTDDPSYNKLSTLMKETNTEMFNKSVVTDKDNRTYIGLIDKKPVASSKFRNADSIITLFSSNKIVQIVSKNYFAIDGYNQGNASLNAASYLVLKENRKIRIEPSGAYYKEGDFNVAGYWFLQRLADTLPFDY